MLDTRAFCLCLCTDRALALGRPLPEAVEEAIDGGVTIVQLREKDISIREFYEIAVTLREITKRRKVPLVINDRLDIALASGADGIHIGKSDLPLEAVRAAAGDRLFIGVSAGTVDEALLAEAGGADYIGAGPVFPTGSKADAGKAIGPNGLRAICGAVRIPVIGIGGINPANAAMVLQSGAAGAAVISAILSQPDIRAAACDLRRGMTLV